MEIGYFLSSEEHAPNDLVARRAADAGMSPVWISDHYLARLCTLPEEPPPVHVSGFGPKATTLAAKIGDGDVSMSPNTCGGSAEFFEMYAAELGTASHRSPRRN